MRVTNNLYVLNGSYYSAVNNSETLGDAYGIRTPKGVILIDCGQPATGLVMMKETLAYFGVSEPITHCIVTHAHHDHCGSAKELQDAGAKIIVGKEDAAYCTNGGVWGMYTPYDIEQAFPAFTPDVMIAEDQSLEINDLLFEFIKIPGHTMGSLAIRVTVDEKTALFTGDMLQPTGVYLNTYDFGWCGDPSYSRQITVESIMKLRDVKTDMILPGHGSICLRNGSALLKHAAQEAFTTLR